MIYLFWSYTKDRKIQLLSSMALLGDRIQQKLDLPTELCQTFYSHQAGSGELPGGGGRVCLQHQAGRDLPGSPQNNPWAPLLPAEADHGNQQRVMKPCHSE